jgi:hypothetical protein
MITPAHRTPIRSILFAVFLTARRLHGDCTSPHGIVVYCVVSLRKLLAFVFVCGVDFVCGFPAAPEPWLSLPSRNVRGPGFFG